MSNIAHYCQKCLAANPLGQDFCARCGTRLMIIVEPPAARYETGEAPPSTDEHLLERISSLENKFSRLTEKLERGLDLLLRQAQNSYFDRALVKALIGLLTEDGLVKSERLEQLWNDRCQKDAAEQEESARRDALRLRILGTSRGEENEEFEKLISEGFLLIEDKQVERGIRSLQRAADLAPANQLLLSYLGEHYFRTGKTRIARSYLSRAHEAVPGDVRLALLLGLTCADEGDPERAKELLNSTTRLGGSSFAAHYGLGRLFAAEENWRQALREFKRALTSRPSPEAHYVLGCLYYQLGRDPLALRHLHKAIEMDSSYGEAFYLSALIYKRTGQEDLARQAFEQVALTDYVKPARRRRALERSLEPTFDIFIPRTKKLVTGGNLRLARTLREDALKAFVSSDSNSR
ncbi:MAG TPA: tetratricopeptide repeat protein [Pyrinomonadaceae bacterium]|nr:tetratricopeptide repeat protein [Pyrinomonadaceae bacterium]